MNGHPLRVVEWENTYNGSTYLERFVYFLGSTPQQDGLGRYYLNNDNTFSVYGGIYKAVKTDNGYVAQALIV